MFTKINEVGYGFNFAGGPFSAIVGFAGGPNVSYGPYDRPHLGRELGRDFGRDLGQQHFGPSAGVHRPNTTGQSFKSSGPNGQHSGQANAGPNFGQNSTKPNVNYVGLESSMRNNGPNPWRTKPRARVFDFDSSQCVGLPQIPDFNLSDILVATQYESNFDNIDLYVPVPVETSSWYPNSGPLTMSVRMLLV